MIVVGSNERVWSHMMASFTAVVWGATFISTKILLLDGMTPAEIMLLRFILGYLLMCGFNHRIEKNVEWHDELLFLMMGIFGGSGYFLAENTALKYTQASNVALICALVPVVTALLSHVLVKSERFTTRFMFGACVAFLGVAVVVLNGRIVLELNPIGDLLTFVATVCWAIYCVIIKLLHRKYSVFYITRKMFFYGILSIIPYFVFYEPFSFPMTGLLNTKVMLNVLFLGVVASGFCFLLWNRAMESLGVIITNNYVFLIPAVTILVAHVFLDEQVTVFTFEGAALTIGGMWWTCRE